MGAGAEGHSRIERDEVARLGGRRLPTWHDPQVAGKTQGHKLLTKMRLPVLVGQHRMLSASDRMTFGGQQCEHR